MEILVNTKVNLLLETVDLICAYVNRIDPALLTSDEPFCIPPAEMEQIMEQVCDGLNRNDPQIQLYFRGYPNAQCCDNQPVISSVASVLFCSGLRTNESDIAKCRALMHESPLGWGRPYRITSFSRGIGLAVCDEYHSLADELETVEMPGALRLRLAMVLTDYHHHVDELCALLEPYALRLLPLLEPVMARMEPRAQQWREVLSTEEGQRQFFSRINANTDTVQHLEIGMRIFYPAVSSGYCRVDEGQFYCSTGLGLLPEPNKKRSNLSGSDIAAIQLLSSIDRLRVLKALYGRYMTCSELAQELQMNRGTLFRDLNNLLQAGLVYMIAEGTSRTYTANIDKLEKTVAQMVRFVRSGGM